MNHSRVVRFGAGFATVVAALGLGLGAGVDTVQAQEKKLVYSSMTPTLMQLPSVVLKLKKAEMLQSQGLAVDFVTVTSCADAVRVIATGDAPIGEVCTDTAINAIEKAGAGIAIITAQTLTAPYDLISSPGIKTLDQLKGMKVAVASVKSGSALIARKMLAHRGKVEGKDYSLVGAGFTPNRYVALKNGAVDAAMMTSPFDMLLANEGYHSLLDTSEVLADYPFISIAVNKAWAKTHRDELMRFLRAYSNMLTWVATPGNRGEMVRILASEVLRNPEHAKFSDATYEKYIRKSPLFPTKLGISEKGILMVMELAKEEGSLSAPLPPVGKFIDPGYARELTK